MLITYGYDGASRLNGLVYTKGINLIGTLTYVYDASGRRIQIGGSLARSGLPQAVASASYNAANWLTQWNGANLTFDLNGNTTSGGTNSYTWDARNHLSSIAGPGLAASFGYDAFGKRLSKTMNALTTGYLYDLLNVAQELSGENSHSKLADWSRRR